MSKVRKLTRLKLINFDELSEEDVKTGKDFIITNYLNNLESVVKRKSKQKKDGSNSSNTNGSIYSNQYGVVSMDDEESFKNRYSCDCGEVKGTLYEGTVCSKCGTEVVYRPENIDITGWLRIDNFCIIHPVLYFMIKNIIGSKAFNEILEPPQLDVHGMPIVNNKNKYANIGMVEFKEKIVEILDYYMQKKYKNRTDKDDDYNFIINNLHNAFTHNIPVFSLILRPIGNGFGENEHKYTTSNKLYTKIVQYVESLNNIKIPELEMSKVLHTLIAIQRNYMELVKYCCDLIGLTKKSFIRSNLLGAKFNYVARNVIVPSTKALRIDEVEMNYLCFLELFKLEIENILQNILGYSATEASNKIFNASLRFDDMVYQIMLDLINNKDKPVKVIINRNPTLHFYSIMYCRVANISKDYNDKTLKLNLNILAPLNADFDGDVLNIVSVKDKEISDALEVFSPVNMLIGRSAGGFNGMMNLIRDQVICLNQFGKLGYEDERVI